MKAGQEPLQQTPCPDQADDRCVSSKTTEQPVQPDRQLSESYRQPPEKELQNLAGNVHCPESPDRRNKAGAQWYQCLLQSSTSSFFSPYGKDYPLSYMTPADKNFTLTNPARIRVYLHPDDNGSAVYAKEPSSFAWRQDAVEIHPVEQQYGSQGNYTGWWVYSGNQVGAVANYNGRQIAAAIDYVVERYKNRVDLDKGIYLVGKSLGGAGVMHQAMILPRYQNRIAIVDGIIALMMISKNHEAQVKAAWGTKAANPELYAAVDFRRQWRKVQEIHFHWRGGQNDNYNRFDREFIDICERHKISCSLTWLQSGHSITEPGYSLNMDLFTDPNQDVTLDKILPVITNNTSNFHGELRGYHNRGVTWNHRAIEDRPDRIVIPLQYQAMINLGPDLPDQPGQVTFSVTPRHVRNFSFKPGEELRWRFGQQYGAASVDRNGLLTIDGLELMSGEGYRQLVITRVPVAAKSVTSPRIAGADLSEDVVYTRVPRTTGSHTIHVKGAEYVLQHADIWDSLPEVARQFSGFNAPGQLVYRHRDGREEVIYDCVGKPAPCVPLDPSVSLDGTRIAFSVYRSANLQAAWPHDLGLPNKVLGKSRTEAQIYLYDISSGQLSPWPHTSGVHDIGPVWLPDGRMMFGSTRNGFYAPFLNRIGSSANPEPRLFIANVDGTGVEDISPHEVTAALHPYLLNSGRVAYSSQWLSHNLGYNSTNGSINWPGTTSNFWSILDVDYRGVT
ncbi:MAG: hypothetical protein R3E57_05305 [Porticoccaceae bacterium]